MAFVVSGVARTLLRCVVMFVMLAGVAPVGATAESLHEVVDYVLATSPELRAIAANRNAIDMELNAARGLALPTIDAQSDVSRHWQKQHYTAGTQDSGTWNERGAGFTLVQRIFDGFEERHEVARQVNRVESARNRVADTANSLALRAVQAYLEVQRAAHVVDVARGNLASLRKLLDRVKARVAAGKGNAADESEASARIENGKALLQEAEGRLADAQSLYLQIIGRKPGHLATVNPPRKGMPASVEQAVATARQFAPAILATQFDAVAAEAAVGSAHAKLMPRLNLEVTGDRSWGGPSYDVDRRGDAAAMLVVRWNLFNGGIDKARIAEYSARAEEARNVSANTERIVEREVRVSWSGLRTAEARATALRRQLVFNRKTRSIYGDQFDTGQRRLLDLLEIQNEVFVAEATLATEELAARYHVFRVLAAMGVLVDAMSAEMPAAATRPHAASLLEGWNVWRIERAPAMHTTNPHAHAER